MALIAADLLAGGSPASSLPGFSSPTSSPSYSQLSLLPKHPPCSPSLPIQPLKPAPLQGAMLSRGTTPKVPIVSNKEDEEAPGRAGVKGGLGSTWEG